MSYSTKIQEFRESRKMTHQEFGDAVGVSRGAVQQWEKGATAPTRKNQPVVAKFIGITVGELMADKDHSTVDSRDIAKRYLESSDAVKSAVDDLTTLPKEEAEKLAAMVTSIRAMYVNKN
jgi:transcriptional regulator with XRE-family HTH domain